MEGHPIIDDPVHPPLPHAQRRPAILIAEEDGGADLAVKAGHGLVGTVAEAAGSVEGGAGTQDQVGGRGELAADGVHVRAVLCDEVTGDAALLLAFL